MAIKDNKSDAEYFEWTTEEEIKLFSALNGLKPVGINRYYKHQEQKVLAELTRIYYSTEPHISF